MNNLYDNLPEEIKTKIMLFNRSAEAEVFESAWYGAAAFVLSKIDEVASRTHPWQWVRDDADSILRHMHRVIDRAHGGTPHRLYQRQLLNRPRIGDVPKDVRAQMRLDDISWYGPTAYTRPGLFLGLIDRHKMTMKDIKRICIDNGLTKKSFKNKKEALGYLIKNV